MRRRLRSWNSRRSQIVHSKIGESPMRLMRVLKLIGLAAAAAGIMSIGDGAGAQAFRDTDWLLYRGSAERVGHNAGDNPLPPPKKGQVWVWPPSQDMPSPLVVDNGPG